jgi:undecaprenyl-diphosphatase
MDATVAATLVSAHPLGWWLAGLVAAGLAGPAALWCLRASRRHGGPLLRRAWPAALDARWALLAGMAAAGLAVVLAGSVMAELAESGSEQGGGWGAVDDAIAAGLRQQAPAEVLRFFATLTHLGDTGVLTALTALVACGLWWRRHRLLALGWLAAMAGNGALTRILKSIFERARPEHLHHGIAQADGYSFPSGHSSASMVAYTLMAYLATRLLPRPWHLPAVVLAGVLVFTTGWSRMVLQVHYASDVLAGWLLGGTWMVCTVLVIESVTRWRHRGDGGAIAQAGSDGH